MRQAQWSEYEAAILLEGYLEWKDYHVPRLRIVRSISCALRQMASNAGAVIDDVYRNENGISYQIQSMDSAYVGHKVYVPATKLFTRIVEIYRTDKQRYERILKEAKSLILPIKSNKEAFMVWAASSVSMNNTKWLESNLKKVESFGNKAGIISGDLFDVLDVAVIDALFKGIAKSKVFQVVNRKLYKYILQSLESYRDYLSSIKKENAEENIAVQNSEIPSIPSTEKNGIYSSELLAVTETIISTCFVNGMRINASIAKKKFKSAYLEQTGTELPEDIDVDDLISHAGYEYSEKIYAVSSENTAQIRKLITTAFESGNHVVYYEEMFAQNADFMSTAGIFSSALLKAILKQMLPEYRYRRSCFSKADDDSLDKDIIASFSVNDIMKS